MLITQANSTSGNGFDPKENRPNIYDCMINEKKASDAIIKTETPNLYLLPAHLDLVGAEIELINHPNRERIMGAALEDIKNEFDFIFIDCSPFTGAHYCERTDCRRCSAGAGTV